MSTQVHAHAKKPTESSSTSQQKGLMQRRATRAAEPAAIPPVVHEVLNSPGQPLDASTRAFMEPRFGHDFSRVRVHTDEQAEKSARAVNADAYTVRDHVVFGTGQYAPGTNTGQRLLAHELTHVAQQASGPVAGTQVADSLSMSNPADSSERAADVTSEKLMSEAPITNVTTPAISSVMSQGHTVLRRQQAKQNKQPSQKTPQETKATISQSEAWSLMRGGIIRDLEQNFRDIGNAAHLDAKQQVYEAFASYDENLKEPIDHEFSKILGAGASNAPQGEAPGFIAGALNEVVDAVINYILSNDDEIKKLKQLAHKADVDIETLLVFELAIRSDTYSNFERGAVEELRQQFIDYWERLGPQEKTRDAVNVWMRLFEGLARGGYGIDSARGKVVIAQLHTKVEEKLKPVKTELDTLQRKYNKKKRFKDRLKLTAIVGTLAGGVIGGLAGGLAGAAIGAAIGLALPLLLELGLLLSSKLFDKDSQKSDSAIQPASPTEVNKKTQP